MNSENTGVVKPDVIARKKQSVRPAPGQTSNRTKIKLSRKKTQVYLKIYSLENATKCRTLSNVLLIFEAFKEIRTPEEENNKLIYVVKLIFFRQISSKKSRLFGTLVEETNYLHCYAFSLVKQPQKIREDIFLTFD